MSNIKVNKKVKTTIQDIFESELKPMVQKEMLKKKLKKQIKEAKDTYNFPGYVITNQALKDSAKQNTEAMNMVSDKIQKYLDFKNNSNPEFPHQNNSKTDYHSPMYRNSSEEEEFIEDWRGMGLNNIQYQNKPNSQFEDQVNNYIDGSIITGNNTGKDSTGQQVGNVVPSNLGKNIKKQTQRKYKKLQSDEWAEAIPNRYGRRKANANYMVAEALNELTQNVLKEGIKNKSQRRFISEEVKKELDRRVLNEQLQGVYAFAKKYYKENKDKVDKAAAELGKKIVKGKTPAGIINNELKKTTVYKDFVNTYGKAKKVMKPVADAKKELVSAFKSLFDF